MGEFEEGLAKRLTTEQLELASELLTISYARIRELIEKKVEEALVDAG